MNLKLSGLISKALVSIISLAVSISPSFSEQEHELQIVTMQDKDICRVLIDVTRLLKEKSFQHAKDRDTEIQKQVLAAFKADEIDCGKMNKIICEAVFVGSYDEYGRANERTKKVVYKFELNPQIAANLNSDEKGVDISLAFKQLESNEIVCKAR